MMKKPCSNAVSELRIAIPMERYRYPATFSEGFNYPQTFLTFPGKMPDLTVIGPLTSGGFGRPKGTGFPVNGVIGDPG